MDRIEQFLTRGYFCACFVIKFILSLLKLHSLFWNSEFTSFSDSETNPEIERGIERGPWLFLGGCGESVIYAHCRI